jgi:hypothetical protein
VSHGIDVGEAVAGRGDAGDAELVAGADVARDPHLRPPSEMVGDRHAQIDDLHGPFPIVLRFCKQNKPVITREGRGARPPLLGSRLPDKGQPGGHSAR